MELIATAKDEQGRRFELTLTAPEDYATVLGVNEAERRLRHMLQKEVNRSVEVLSVSLKDETERRDREGRLKKAGIDPKKRAANVGPDQVAFAGTKESVEIPDAAKSARGQKKER